MASKHSRASAADRGARPFAPRLGGLEITFGVALPLLCLLLDPCVFTMTQQPLLGLGPDPFFPHWRAAAWAFVLVECGALVAYALWLEGSLPI